MNFFCTFFDKRYLARGVALHHSLLAQGAPFHLWVLCMDRETAEALSSPSLQDVTLVTVEDLERADQRVAEVRRNRSLVEFYFTSKSFLCAYIFACRPDVDLLTYVDADGYFFGSPEAIAEEMRGSSVGLTGHRFPPRLKFKERHGLFNAGFVSFRRDATGMAALAWWRDRCTEWCHDYVEDGRYADQGYLNDLPRRFDGVRVITHKGINAAPWNLSQYRLTLSDRRILLDGDPLIFYHFHGVKRIGTSWYETGMSLYGASVSGRIRRHVYRPYIDELMKAGDPRPGPERVIRIERGPLDRFLRLCPAGGRWLQAARKIALGIAYRSMIRYRNREAER